METIITLVKRSYLGHRLSTNAWQRKDISLSCQVVEIKILSQKKAKFPYHFLTDHSSPDESVLNLLRANNASGRFWIGASDFEDRGKFKWYYSGKQVIVHIIVFKEMQRLVQTESFKESLHL